MRLLALGRHKDAERRLLGIRFFSAMLGRFPVFVLSLRHWRAIGLERAREGYSFVALHSADRIFRDQRDGDAWAHAALCLQKAGFVAVGIAFARLVLRGVENEGFPAATRIAVAGFLVE